jgi:DNA-binding IclR family transcriptional regulator
VNLPQKGRRITAEGLLAFLLGTEGRWFRLLDLEAHFRVNKKTAWSYLNLLLKAGLLEHNGEKANRVRYVLASPFRAPNSSPYAAG